MALTAFQGPVLHSYKHFKIQTEQSLLILKFLSLNRLVHFVVGENAVFFLKAYQWILL